MKIIRLTESDLHNIVKESVNKILNEIGDTPKGQYMLGALMGRKLKNKDKSWADVQDYALKQANKYGDTPYKRFQLDNASKYGYEDTFIDKGE